MIYNDFFYKEFMEIFFADFVEKQKEADRRTIKAMLHAKSSRVSTIKNNSTKQLHELAEAMHDKTKNKIPNDLEGALEGKAAKAGHSFLKDVSKPILRSAVKG